MARPSYGKNDATARDRLIEAFWVLLEERPYAKITVSVITDRAAVNRNTFYYHFSCIDDLAHAAVSENLLPEAFLSLLESFDSAKVDGILRTPDIEERVGRLSLVAGPHGSAELVGVLKETVFDAWCNLLGIEKDKLRDEDIFVLDFVLGGLIAVYPSISRHDDLGAFARRLFDTGIPQLCFQLIGEIAERTKAK